MHKIGLALSGGGSKGVAHIGVAKALEDENIELAYLAGTSSGSIVAALLAAKYSPNEITKIFKYNLNNLKDVDGNIPFKLFKSIFTGKFHVKGIVKGDNLESILRNIFYQKGIRYMSDIKVPLYIPVTDLKENKTVVFTNKDKMDIASVIRASCSYPGIFVPKYIGNKPYVDGGIKLNNPANLLKNEGVPVVVSVDFTEKEKSKKIYNMIDVVTESIDMMSDELKDKTKIESDVKINIVVEKKGLLDFSRFNQYLNLGYSETKKKIPEILAKCNNIIDKNQ